MGSKDTLCPNCKGEGQDPDGPPGQDCPVCHGEGMVDSLD